MILRETYEVARLVLDEMGEKNTGLIAAGCAFYGLVAVFPGIGAVIALFGLVADPAFVETQLELMQRLMPAGTFSLFQDQVGALLAARSEALGFATAVSVFVALWSVRAGVAALIQGLNAIFERPNRELVRHFLVAWVVAVSLIAVAVVALFVLVLAPLAFRVLRLDAETFVLLVGLRWIVAFVVMLVGLGILYRYGPNRRNDRLAWITPGAVLVVILWVLMSEGFTTYVTHFDTYNRVYGALGAVVATLFWFYFSAFLVLFGATLNMVLDRRKPL